MMGSIGWYILGYFGLGVVVWLMGAVVIAIIAAVQDFKWDREHDPDMNRTDTLDALSDVADEYSKVFKYQCDCTDNSRKAFGLATLKTLATWPKSLPLAFSIVWKEAVELRDRRRT